MLGNGLHHTLLRDRDGVEDEEVFMAGPLSLNHHPDVLSTVEDVQEGQGVVAVVEHLLVLFLSCVALP